MVAHVPRPCELSVVEFLHELGCSTEHGDGGEGGRGIHHGGIIDVSVLKYECVFVMVRLT